MIDRPTNTHTHHPKRKDTRTTMDATATHIQTPGATTTPPASDDIPTTASLAPQTPARPRRKRRGKDARERRRWMRLVAAAVSEHDPPYCPGIDVPCRFVAAIARWLGHKDIIVRVRDAHVEEYRTLTIWHRTRFDPLALAAAIDADLDAEQLAEARTERRIGRPRGSRTIPRPWGATA